MPEWRVQFVQFNGTMTMTVVDPTGEMVGRWQCANTHDAGRIFEVAVAKQSFEVVAHP